jgi:hypothetical protein
MPVPSTKWSATRDTMTFATGSTLTVDAGATFSCSGYVASTVATLNVTTTAVVGTTFQAKGLSTFGTVASGKAILVSPTGAGADPGANNLMLYTDGASLLARRNADAKVGTVTVVWA